MSVSSYVLPGDCQCIVERLSQFNGVDRNNLWFLVLWLPTTPMSTSPNTPSSSSSLARNTRQTNQPILCKQRFLPEITDSSGRAIDVQSSETTNKYTMTMIIGPMDEEWKADEIARIDLTGSDVEERLRKIAAEKQMLAWAK